MCFFYAASCASAEGGVSVDALFCLSVFFRGHAVSVPEMRIQPLMVIAAYIGEDVPDRLPGMLKVESQFLHPYIGEISLKAFPEQ